MNDFITKFQNELAGTLSGFDRLVFRGTLWRNRLSGMKGYLWAHGLGSKDFGEHAEQVLTAPRADLAVRLPTGKDGRAAVREADHLPQLLADRDGVLFRR